MNIKVDFDNIVVKEDRNDFNVKVLMLKGEKGDQGDGEPNVIEKVQVNGSDLPVTNKAVNVPVPVLDSALSSSSTNPVQNKAIYTALSNKANTTDLNNYYEISEVDNLLNNKADVSLLNKKPYYFDTVADMLDYDLEAGDLVITKGYYSANDGGGASYEITDEESITDYQESLDNQLYATLLINESVTPEMFGAKGDGTTNDTLAFTKMIKCKKKICGLQGKIYFINWINIDEDYVYMENVHIKTNSVSSSSTEIRANTSKRMFQFNNEGDFTFINCIFETDADQETTTEWLSEYVTTPCSNVNFMYFLDGVQNLNVDRCIFKNGVFDLWVTFDGTEVLKGICNITNCQSYGSCIFYNSRWVKENNIYNCTVHQGNNATTYSHCIYVTYGVGMKVNIDNCKLNTSANGGVPVDIYHGSQYNVHIDNTDLIVNNPSNNYALLIAGEGSRGIVSNCRIKGQGDTALIYQNDTNENNEVIFNNCNIKVKSLNRNAKSSNLACIFKNCDLDFERVYYSSQLTGYASLKFYNSVINLTDQIDYVNTQIINCHIKSVVNAVNKIPISFRTKGLFIENYLENIGEINPNFSIYGNNTDTPIVNNIFSKVRENNIYQGTGVNNTYINIP